MLEKMQPNDKELVGHCMWVATQVAAMNNLSQGYRIVVNNGKEGC